MSRQNKVKMLNIMVGIENRTAVSCVKDSWGREIS